MKKSGSLRAELGLLLLMIVFGGCTPATQNWFKTSKTRFLSADKVVDSRLGSPVNPIYSSVGPADTAQDLFPNATFPNEEDLEYAQSDYVIGPTDVLSVSILDLFAEGLETVLQRQVSETGFIDLPLLPNLVRATGLTKEQLKEEIISAYRPDILRDPTISVTVIAQHQSTFSIVGAIARPGPYSLIRKDMRLLEALAMAGGITQPNIPYVYIIRPSGPAPIRSPRKEAPKSLEDLPELPSVEKTPEKAPVKDQDQAEEDKAGKDIEDALRILGEAMPGRSAKSADQVVMPEYVELAESSSLPSAGSGEVPQLEAPRSTKWVYSDGQWIQVEQDAETAPQPSGEGAAPVTPAQKGRQESSPEALARQEQDDPFGWRQLDKAGSARIIAISLTELESGNQRVNIVIRDKDTIQIPLLERGEFYVMGEVSRPGVYDLTGRHLTLKMAVAAAGNPGPLAWPSNSILIRRIGRDQEQIIPVNLEAIFQGTQPDIFLKPNDILAVGTDIRASFFAVIRNSFRMTYGFGFIWDRNFANPYQTGPDVAYDSRRFLSW